jgi:GNAT superfamily N-acetyltransferase
MAVDEHWQGQGIRRALIGDAACRVAHAADVIWILGIVVLSILDAANDCYLAL